MCIFVTSTFYLRCLCAQAQLYTQQIERETKQRGRTYSYKTNPFSEFFHKTSQAGCTSLHYIRVLLYILLCYVICQVKYIKSMRVY